MKKTLVTIILLFVFALPASVLATNQADSTLDTVRVDEGYGAGIKLLSTEKHILKGEEFTLKVLKDNDRLVYGISDVVKDKELVANYANAIINGKEYSKNKLKNAAQSVPDVRALSSCYLEYFVNQTVFSPTSSDVRTTSTFNFCHKQTDYYAYVKSEYIMEAGSTAGSWTSSDPFLPNKIVLSQVVESSGLNMTIGAPPSWDQVSNTATWTGEYTGIWYAYATRPETIVSANMPFGFITSVKVKDGAEVHVTQGNFGYIHKANVDISL